MSQKVTTRDLRKYLRFLRKRFPIEGSVKVRRRRLISAYESYITFICDNRAPIRYVIHIDNTMDESKQHDALKHEYAHAKAINDACYHQGNQWASTYGEIYKAWADEFNEGP